MRVVSTQLRMTENFTSDEYFSVIIKWLKDSSPCRGVGELFEQSDSKESTRVVAGYCTLETVTADKDGAHYHLAKLSHIFHEQTWETEIILKSAENVKDIFIHVDCLGDATRFDAIPNIRSEVIRAFVQSGKVRPDELPIQSTPIEATYQNQHIIADAINGNSRLLHPLVFVTKIRNTRGYEVSPDDLAFQLSGLAHVVIDTDDDYSFSLRDLTNATNPYNGRIGIYYMDGKPKVLRLEDGVVQPLERIIVGEIIRNVTAQVNLTAPTWDEFYRDKLQQDARQSEELMMEAIDVNGSLEERLRKAKEQVQRLTEENLQLKAKNESLQAALTEREGDALLHKSPIEEWYEGEQNDLIVNLMQRALRDTAADSRAYELLSDLLSQNPEVGAGRAFFGRLKAILARGETLNERNFRDLQELGFDVTSDNTHYRLTFHGSEYYKFTLPKTPSDYREGKNSLSNITKRLSIYK